MIKIKAILFTVVVVLLNCLFISGQENRTTSEQNKIEKLGAEDLLFRDDSVEMNVISASRSSKRIDELPITIYVVTREEIIRNHYNSLIDVIKSLPGLRVSQPGSGELGESFQLRGLIGNLYTMILINGLPIKPSAVIGMPVLSQLPVRQAERIEVIYGPAAAVYGATEQRIKSELADEEIKGLEIKTLKAESSRRENELKLLMKERELDRSEKDRLAQSLVLEQEKNQVRENEQKVRSLEQQQEIQLLQIKQKDDEALVLQKTNESLEKDKILKETELENEKFTRKMAVWVGALMVLVAVIILLSLISSRRKNQKLAESKKQIEKINSDLEIKNTEVLKQNEKILQQKDIIEQKNQSITDSIQYASRIQTAVLPPIDFISEWGIENFILYKPKDIVSGDFYWGLKKDKKIIVAAGDCTGAGEARDGMDIPISSEALKAKNICINHSRIFSFAILISQWIFRKRFLITHLKNGKANANRLMMCWL